MRKRFTCDIWGIYFFTMVTIDSNPLIAVAKIKFSMEIIKVIRIKIYSIIRAGDSIADGNAR